MDEKQLAFTPAWKQRDMIASGEISPVELTELYLRRIDNLNPKLNAYLTVVGDMAMGWAKEAEAAVQRGDALGPLHGVPISIKDLNATKGIRTTNGSLIFKDQVPDADDMVTERIRKSGAIILGKTNTPELGHKGSTENRLGEPCRNPWDTSRTPGGSSGGAAAGQVSGLSALSQGSDGGGSIRIPASFCGLYGIKSTQGRVPSIATGPGGWGQLGQNGPITSNVKDSAMLLQVLSGPDDRDPVCIRTQPPDFSANLDGGVKGLRIGWTPDFGSAPVDPEVRSACEAAAMAFQDLGASVETADIYIDIDDAIEPIGYNHVDGPYRQLRPPPGRTRRQNDRHFQTSAGSSHGLVGSEGSLRPPSPGMAPVPHGPDLRQVRPAPQPNHVRPRLYHRHPAGRHRRQEDKESDMGLQPL